MGDSDRVVTMFFGFVKTFFKMRLGKLVPKQSSSRERSKAEAEAGSGGGEDVVSAAIGECGRWQIAHVFLLALFSFPCTFHIYLPTFTAKETNFWCRKPPQFLNLSVQEWINYSQPDSACYSRVLGLDVTEENILNHSATLTQSFQKCQKWDFDRTDVGNTIISEWDLVCDQSGLTSLAEVVFLVGVGVGGVLGGWISDKFGRKRVLMTTLVAQSVLGIISILVRTYWEYVMVRLIMGLVSVSVVYAAFVLAVELVGGKWVTIAGVSIFFPLPIAYILVSLLSMALPDWRDLQLAVSIPGCFLLFLWFILPESPRWLLNRGRVDEVKEILKTAAKFNRTQLPADLDKALMVHKRDSQSDEPSVLHIVKGPLLKITVILFVAWFSMTIAYYGLLLNIGKFKLGNLHVTSIVLASVEIPAIAISIPILLKAGRRMPTILSMMACGIACVASQLCYFFAEGDWMVILCLMVGKFAISSTNMMLPIYTAELYPTMIRNMGVGASQISAGLALICTPYLWELAMFNKYLPMMTIAAMSALGGAIVILLPETSNTKNEPQELDNTD